MGFVVPKFGHSAVERNRLKRRLREIVRTKFLGTLPVADLVIRTRPEAYTTKLSILTDELHQLVQAVAKLAL
jgi:ribonuclease P protein component